MTRRYGTWLVVVAVVLAAGCGADATAGRTDEPTRNATLSLSGYERTESASPVETREFWDRSKSWEDPGNRTVRVTSRVHAYRNSTGTDAVVVYTTPKRPYVGSDRVRSLSAPDLADLATRSVEAPPLGDEGGPTYRASLLGEEVTVRTVVDAEGEATDHVAHATHGDVIVVVVVADEAGGRTVERVLRGVVIDDGVAPGG